MSRRTGTTTWIDLSVQDLDAAKTFYAGLFGWTFDDMGEQFGHYHLIRNEGALVGGAMGVAGMTCPDGGPLPSTWGGLPRGRRHRCPARAREGRRRHRAGRADGRRRRGPHGRPPRLHRQGHRAVAAR